VDTITLGVGIRKVCWLDALPAELVCSAVQMTTAQCQPAASLIVHSDRGSQYTSAAHQAVIDQFGLVMSMSRKGNCWDKAVMERASS